MLSKRLSDITQISSKLTSVYFLEFHDIQPLVTAVLVYHESKSFASDCAKYALLFVMTHGYFVRGETKMPILGTPILQSVHHW